MNKRRRQCSGRRKGGHPEYAVAEAQEHSADDQSGSEAPQAQRLHITLPSCGACRAESHGDRKLTSACGQAGGVAWDRESGVADGQWVRGSMGPRAENVLNADSGRDCTTLNTLESGGWHVSKSGFCGVWS